jgi:hypothetical protein
MAGMVTVSAVAIVFVLGWCWVIGPACTAAKLFDNIRNGQTEDACAMVRSRDERISVKHIRECNYPNVGTLVARPRTWLDLIVGREVFEFEHYHKPFFTVERGHVVEFQLGQPIFAFTVEIFQ